ncbi:transcriptional regulator, DeoR family [Sediminispirochaeta smaragdinae DSM 11293]|uniref:Transcriptional regulator, DeoR family n=2 Tax=Sediminispirochaeta TaxID=1911556 RepID=E1RC67_SEDSS|nr:transcriptional regulator, DeoR family [Sediminispirochaeta smaragdinae DSM 11293]
MIDMGLLYQVAYDYYVNKKLQREIANELNVSRVQISKYLAKAEEVGIVKIEVIQPTSESKRIIELKERLMKLFKLKDILIAPSYGNHSQTLDGIHKLASNYVYSAPSAENPLTIGLGWGSTVYSFVTSNFDESRRNWKIIPLTGGSSLISSRNFNINHIAHTFAEKIGATAQLVYLPLLVDGPKKAVLTDSNDYRKINELWSNLDVLICSVGYSIPRSPLFNKGLIGEEYIKRLEDNNVVGDILTHYFNEKGEMIHLGVEANMINISLEQIASAKTKLIIAYGKQKTKSILGGLRSRLIDVLVTDADTVERVLHEAESKGN